MLLTKNHLVLLSSQRKDDGNKNNGQGSGLFDNPDKGISVMVTK